MRRGAFQSITWLVAAVYLLDGVLAGAAHFHGHSHEKPQQVAASPEHQDHGCPHGHDHHAPESTIPSEHAPAAPDHHDDCAACRYSSLQAQPVALAAPPEFGQALALVESVAPIFLVAKVPSLHLARAPPAAA